MKALRTMAWLAAVSLAGCAGTLPHVAPPGNWGLATNESGSGAFKRSQHQGPANPQDPPPSRQDPKTWPAPVHDDQWFGFFRAEQLEYRLQPGNDLLRWEAQGWYGGDYNRLWLKTEGEQTVEGKSEGDAEVQALYSRMIAPFWDLQVGARYDRVWGPGADTGRWFGVLGVQGLSPYEFEVEPALFVSEDGDVSARLTATTDFLITQRLVLQPRLETEVSFQDVPEFSVGQGFNYVDLGLRLRYEFRREFAPYLGINWVRWLGETEDLVRQDGGRVDDLAFVVGLRFWF